jgi:hypothetical protein
MFYNPNIGATDAKVKYRYYLECNLQTFFLSLDLVLMQKRLLTTVVGHLAVQ